MKTIPMTYDDRLITCTPDTLVIRHYGPLLRSKRIPYTAIRRAEKIHLGPLRRWRLWGTADPRRWFNLDLGRPRKSVGFVIDTGRLVSPVITPDRPEQLVQALRDHDVHVIG